MKIVRPAIEVWEEGLHAECHVIFDVKCMKMVRT